MRQEDPSAYDEEAPVIVLTDFHTALYARARDSYTWEIYIYEEAHDVATVHDTPDIRHTIVGHSDTGVGFLVHGVEEIPSQEIEAGDTWSLVLEDYFNHRNMCDAVAQFHNVQGLDVHLLVTQVVNGVSVTLINETIAGHGIITLPLHCPAQHGLRPMDTVTTKRHRVTFTNNEPTHSAFAAVVISGWSTTPTTLPVSNI